MADVLYCKHCGGDVLPTGYCSACGLKLEFVYKVQNTSKYYYNLGLDKARVRDMTGAKDALLTALKYDKMNIDARNLLGLVYYETGEVVEALSQWVISVNYFNGRNPAKRYIKDVKSSPHKMNATNSVARKYNQALTYATQGSKDLAFIQLRKILSENTKFINGYLLLALLFIDDGKYDKARKALKRVIKIDRTNPLAVRYFNEMGHSDEEIMAFRDYPDEDYDADQLFVEDNLRKYIEPEEIDVNGNVKSVGAYKDINFYKFSLAYVIAGLFLGFAVMWFLVLPQYNRDTDEEARELKISYSKEIAEKNTKINSLEDSVESLTAQVESLESQVSSYEAQDTGDMTDSEISYLQAGISYYESEDYERAVSAFDTVLESHPYNDSARYFEALAHLALEDEDSAAVDLAYLIVKCPDSIYYTAATSLASSIESYSEDLVTATSTATDDTTNIEDVLDTDNE